MVALSLPTRWRSPTARRGVSLSLLMLMGVAAGCGGYYYDGPSDYDDPSSWHDTSHDATPVKGGHTTPPTGDGGTAPADGGTDAGDGGSAPGDGGSAPGDGGTTTGPTRGGFVIVTGDDADDLWHCEGNACGGLYPALFKAALGRSHSGGKGILAIGVNGRQALSAFNSWNDPALGGPGAPVTHVRGLDEIASVDFSQFAFVYLPSVEHQTLGGLTVQQIAALNARQPDLAHFVNDLGGSLLALTQAGVEGGWGFLPVPLQTQDITFDTASPTDELRGFAPAVDTTDLSHKSFHNVFTGPSGYSGLHVLAFNDEVYNPQKGQPVMLGGVGVVLSAENCSDGIDNDGDGKVDGDDPDCQVCGNGVVDPGETCDDGNVKSGDGCSATCQKEDPCGNGVVDPGETCDDGNRVDGDGCSATCQKENQAPQVTCHDVSVCADPGVCYAASPPGMASATDPDGDAVSLSAYPLGPYPAGTQTVSVTASDGKAQNVCSSQVTVRDCEPPQLTCPGDFQVECTGQGRALVAPPDATATDNCGSAPVMAPPGGYLPLGTTKLTYSSTDGAGNTSTCSPSVTVVDTLPPNLTCPAPIVAECTGLSSAYVTPGDASADDSCTSATVTGPDGDFYPLGTTPVHYSARDTSGNTASCDSTIQVVDSIAPDVSMSPPAPLWPVDQRYRTIRLEDCITVHDQCSGGLTQTGASAAISCVTSDEAQSGTDPDVVFVDSTTVKVRVDRSGTGDGRVYSLIFSVSDPSGNVTQGVCPVSVPLDKSTPAVDSGEQVRTCASSSMGMHKRIPMLR